jgi:hypothetical protein
MIEAMKELKDEKDLEIEELYSENEQLKIQNIELESRLTEIENMLASLTESK